MIEELIQLEKTALQMLGQIQAMKTAIADNVELPPVIKEGNNVPELPDTALAQKKSNEDMSKYYALARSWVLSTKKRKFFVESVYSKEYMTGGELEGPTKEAAEYFMDANITEDFMEMQKDGKYKFNKPICNALFKAHYDDLFNLMLDKCLDYINSDLLK